MPARLSCLVYCASNELIITDAVLTPRTVPAKKYYYSARNVAKTVIYHATQVLVKTMLEKDSKVSQWKQWLNDFTK